MDNLLLEFVRMIANDKRSIKLINGQPYYPFNRMMIAVNRLKAKLDDEYKARQNS